MMTTPLPAPARSQESRPDVLRACVHYFGAHSLSIGDGIKLEDGDVMTIAFEGFGRPLINPLQVITTPATLITAPPL